MAAKRNPKPLPQANPELPPLGVLIHDDDGGRIQCHICGSWYVALYKHLNMAHGMSADTYRTTYGLARHEPLVARVESERRRGVALKHDFAGQAPDWHGLVGQARPRGIEPRLGDRLAKQAGQLSRHDTERPADMVTLTEAAARLGLTKHALQVAIWRKRLPATRHGEGKRAAWYVARTDLDAYRDRRGSR